MDESPAEELGEARFLFDPANIRDSEEPPEIVVRLVWMFLTLIRRREIAYTAYARECRRGTKTFQRDLAMLRDAGDTYGFALGRSVRGVVKLLRIDDLPDERARASRHGSDVLQAVAEALGALVANDVALHVDAKDNSREPFLRFALPQLVKASEVANTFVILRRASEAHARVRFRYPSAARRAPEEREVEPHLVTYYDGRYYLVAYDPRPRTKSWRQFALDRIVGPIGRAGTFKRRPIPPEYRGEDAVGLFKGPSGTLTTVAVALSPTISEAVVARRWQRGQRVDDLGGGWKLLRLEVPDLAEAVRWALGFGAQALIVSPPRAVTLARSTIDEISRAYDAAAPDFAIQSAARQA